MKVNVDKPIEYMIKCVDEKCTLVSLVDTNYNGIAENFVAEGDYEYLKLLKERLEFTCPECGSRGNHKMDCGYVWRNS